jgi:hypothetical protein
VNPHEAIDRLWVMEMDEQTRAKTPSIGTGIFIIKKSAELKQH